MNLKQKYDRADFLKFLDSFLPGFTKDTRPVRADGLKVVHSAVYLGESQELDLSIFELTHSSSTDARVALATAGFKAMKTSATYRALIVYKTDGSDDWRLSLMTATPGVSQKGKIGQTLSNPRRFSFFLGPNAKINTPHQFLIKQGVVKDFVDLQQRFSLEVVNKEFYKKIQEVYYGLVGGTLGQGVRVRTFVPMLHLPSQTDHNQICLEFAVRLIGRIIFCWFLREKKSPNGMPLMPEGLLSLDAASKHSNYYHKILEPIFFEVLNKPAKSRDKLYSQGDFATVPYLNGGLFSPHDDDYYKHYNLVIPDEWLTELFTVLETYNFTIDENTSFDEELSIDPEMLGRIFENLLAEINPETGESARKNTGSYYTPRTIVDYMVDESLLIYLQQKTGIAGDKLKAIISYDLSDDVKYASDSSDNQKIVDAISKIKIIDPACGSGAFPIGALQKIVFILQQIDPQGRMWFKRQIDNVPVELQDVIRREFQEKNFDYIRKLGVIRENIFGVDIQPIATEISRLRCFLTLVVDQSVDDTLENRGIVQLPNLDFKFVTTNSLIGLPDIDGANQADMFDDRQDIDELKSLRDRYFIATGDERSRLMVEFSNLQTKMSKELIIEYGSANPAKLEFTSKLAGWEPFTHKPASWFDPEWMFGVKEGFDVVIANPPYVGEKGHKEMFGEIKNSPLGKRFYQGKMDFFYFFFHAALDNLLDRGVLAFITTNYYPTALGAHNLREDFKKRSIVNRLVDFNELKIFKSAMGQHNIITILIKGQDAETLAKTCITKHTGDATPAVLESIVSGRDKETKYFEVAQKDLYDGVENYIRISGYISVSDNPVQVLLNKIKTQGELLGVLCNVNNGVFAGADKLTKKKREKYHINDVDEDTGIFVLTNKEIDDLSLSDEEKKIIKPLFKNSDINKYYTNVKQELNLINLRYTDRPELDNYPNIKKHLYKFKKLLSDRPRTGTLESAFNGGYWYVMSTSRKLNFDDAKIVFPQRSNTNTFGYNESSWYAMSDVFFVTQKAEALEIELKYILALLNSKLYYLWLYYRGKRKGETLELIGNPVSEIPIKKISKPEQKPFIKIVDKILAITKTDDYLDNPAKKEEVKEYEKQIDQMVYQLHNLTPEEIEIVENSSK